MTKISKKAPKKLSKSDIAKKAWKTREANKIKEAEWILDVQSENLALKKEVEILNSSIKSCESALSKNETKASELFNKRIGIVNKIEELKSELKGIEVDIINLKSNLSAELEILS